MGLFQCISNCGALENLINVENSRDAWIKQIKELDEMDQLKKKSCFLKE